MQAANCPKDLRITKKTKDADESDNEERDESYCSWPNEAWRKTLALSFLIWQFRLGDEEGFVDSTSASIFLVLTIWTLWGLKKKRKDARRRGRTKLMQWVWIEGMVGPWNSWRWKRKSSVDGEELDGPTIFVALLVGSWNLNGYQKTGFNYGGLVAPPIGKYRLVRLGNRFCERRRSDRRWGEQIRVWQCSEASGQLSKGYEDSTIWQRAGTRETMKNAIKVIIRGQMDSESSNS